MKIHSLLNFGFILVFSGLSTTRANTMHSGSYTVDVTQTGAMMASTDGDSITFGHEGVNSVVTPLDAFTIETGAMTAQFQADAGLIFDRVYFGGVVGGAVFNPANNGGFSFYNWTVNGGTFVGNTTSGGPSSPSFTRDWEITGPSTGRSDFFLYAWEQSVFFDFNNPVYGSGYYSIGASSFSMDLLAYVGIWNQGGTRWAGGVLPQGISFAFTYLDAPAPGSSVPETGATAGLMLLAFAGLVGLRRLAVLRRGSEVKPTQDITS